MAVNSREPHAARPDPDADRLQPLGLQSTIAHPVTVSGRGLHTGQEARVTLAPGEPDGGIVFCVRRNGTEQDIPATWTHAVSRPLCTALAAGGPPLLTVEHLLASLSGLRIDNARVTVEGDELPIFDGSARPWCAALETAGRTYQDRPRRALRVLRPVEVAREHRLLRVEPADRFILDIDLALPGFGPLHWTAEPTPDRFVADLAPSRSFGRLKWGLPLKLFHLFRREPVLRGAHFGSTAVLLGGWVIGGMRVPDEPVRHRALDLVGDLALAGRPLLARVTARNVGHEINRALVSKLMAETDAWTLEPAPP